VDGHTIRLEGFRSQNQYVVYVSGSDRQRISLLVVPATATVDTAHDAMTTAAQRGNVDRPEQILDSIIMAQPD
jgi:hypothetical protein